MKQVSLSVQNLSAWAHFNDVKLFEASIEEQIIGDDGEDKGGGLQAVSENGPGQLLVSVPLDLLLSKERVEQCAKADQNLNRLIQAAPSLSQKSRTAILLFLVYQMTINSPDYEGRVLGVNNPFSDYIKMLPHQILLPIFYTTEERELLVGTSLSEALDQKISSLEREFENLKACTTGNTWCERVWWNDDLAGLSFDDWKLADAMYRSRALELPRGVGVGMVPVIDMANHASGDRYNARFEVDEDTESILLITRDGRNIKQGEEITIMYGSGGASEMVFSYGFLEEHASSAREMFLSLSIPFDDPLRLAKIRFSQEAPGVRIYVDDSDKICWESTFVWWACVNQEDGLDFRVERTLDGDMMLMAQWKDDELDGGALRATLMEDHLWDVFVLRAVVMIQERIEQQGAELAASEDSFIKTRPSPHVRASVCQTIGRLRTLEMELLARAYDSLEVEKAALLDTTVVQAYLGNGQATVHDIGENPDDFS